MTSATTVASYLHQQQLHGDTQLQKLVFYAQAWSLAWTGRPLFDDEIQAWKLGPVTPAVWQMKNYRDLGHASSDLTADERAIIDAVYAHYGRMGGVALSALTHAEAPWKDAWDEGRGKNSVITHRAMRHACVEQALEEPAKGPQAPVLTAERRTEDIGEVVERQRRRWRPLLDRLANQ